MVLRSALIFAPKGGLVKIISIFSLVSAAHNQLLGACELMSLSDIRVREIRNGCKTSVETEMKANRQKIVERQYEL